MTLQTSGRHLYEPLLGLVLFEMHDLGGSVHLHGERMRTAQSPWWMTTARIASKNCSFFAGPRWKKLPRRSMTAKIPSPERSISHLRPRH